MVTKILKVTVFILMLSSAALHAQITDTAGIKTLDSAGVKHVDSLAIRHSTINTLSDEQYNHILNGDDIYNLSYVAQLYRYPHPDDILKYRTRLKLSDAQIKRLKEIKATLRLKKVEVGLSVVQNERMIDSLFRTRRLSEGLIIYYTNRYGLYQGEFRGALLIACYNTRKVLNPVQLNQYNELLNHN